jgi:hypothetical protein
VKLTATQAIVTSDGQTLLTYSGGWAWQEWALSGSNLKFVHTGGGSWTEYQNGRAVFTFRETQRTRDSVTLYDSSRGIRVRLTTTQAIVTSDNDRLLTYNGRFRR